MREIEPPFEIMAGKLTINVSEHSIDDSRVFHLVFSDKRKPLNITVAENGKGKKFWTSTPQGRQLEAEELGKLVADYIRSKRKGQ